MDCYNRQTVNVKDRKYEREDIIISFKDDVEKKAFFDAFENVFIEKLLSHPARQMLNRVKVGDAQVLPNEIQYLVNNLSRIFQQNQHYKGIIGEHLFSYISKELYIDTLYEQGPKGRSSAEPGIDYVTINGDTDDYSTIYLTVWETKTSNNSIASRGSEIYEFFHENGSMEQNIDTELTTLLECLKETQIATLKTFMEEIFVIVINKGEKLKIGAVGITETANFTENTFKGFEKTLGDRITKNQRQVKIVHISELTALMEGVKSNIWDLLLSKQP